MNGYVVNLRLRRAGALATTERTWAVPDKDLARVGARALFAMGVLILLFAPLAISALTRPETGKTEPVFYWPSP